MNSEIIDDLKQFISVTVGQHFCEVRSDITQLSSKTDARFDKVESQISDLSQSVAEALHASNEASDAQLKDHETRITHLEKSQAA